MPPKRKLDVTKSDITNPPTLSYEEEVAVHGINYVTYKADEKDINKALATSRVPIEEYLEKHGTTTDKGNIIATARYADSLVTFTKTLRVSSVLVPNALEILKKHKVEDVTELVEIVRQDKLAELVKSGELSDELINELFECKDTYALTVKVTDR